MRDLFSFPCSLSWTKTFVSETLEKVSKLASKICNFPIFIFLKIFKKSKPIIQKSVQESFPNEKSEMRDLFSFPYSLSWTKTFVSETLEKVSKLASKICIFPTFGFLENLQKIKTDHSKKCLRKLQK